ncbi:MAG: peptidylprolyl isomerase, partial [Acidobacteriaceae bacterium]|nr:peptidylprolyl isomerase [Acidobacteriaceae bacterium]
MIRILQQDTPLVKFLLAAIVGLAAISMVVYLVPGFMDATGDSNDATVFATVHRTGLLGRLGFGSEVVKTDAVQQLASRQLQQQHMQLQDLPPQYLSMFMSRAGMSLV